MKDKLLDFIKRIDKKAVPLVYYYFYTRKYIQEFIKTQKVFIQLVKHLITDEWQENRMRYRNSRFIIIKNPFKVVDEVDLGTIYYLNPIKLWIVKLLLLIIKLK